MKNRFQLIAFCVPLLCLTVPLRAQQSGREFSLAAGTSQFDADGTGNAPMAAARIDAPLVGRWLLADLNLSYASLGEQFVNTRTRTGVAEGQLQLQLPLSHIRPYIGVGGGWLHYFNNAGERSSTGTTYSGSVGVRVPLASVFVLRGEMRVREWDATVNSATEYTGGLGFSF